MGPKWDPHLPKESNVRKALFSGIAAAALLTVGLAAPAQAASPAATIVPRSPMARPPLTRGDLARDHSAASAAA